jgi:hypothetical protein
VDRRRHLPFFFGFILVSAIAWSPGGLIDLGQRKTNPDAKPVVTHYRCHAEPVTCE